MRVLLLSGAACLCARDEASRTLLLVSVEVSEARSSMSTINVDTVHSDERTISFSGYICVHYTCAFHGIFYSPETPSDLDYWSLHANAPEPGGPPFLPVR